MLNQPASTLFPSKPPTTSLTSQDGVRRREPSPARDDSGGKIQEPAPPIVTPETGKRQTETNKTTMSSKVLIQPIEIDLTGGEAIKLAVMDSAVSMDSSCTNSGEAMESTNITSESSGHTTLVANESSEVAPMELDTEYTQIRSAVTTNTPAPTNTAGTISSTSASDGTRGAGGALSTEEMVSAGDERPGSPSSDSDDDSVMQDLMLFKPLPPDSSSADEAHS